jgi:hypothetical protein
LNRMLMRMSPACDIPYTFGMEIPRIPEEPS